MRRIAIVLCGLALGAPCAHAADTLSGSGALALAALVGGHAPQISSRDKHALAAMLDGNLAFAYPSNRPIVVKADAITCRSSDVDISAHGCTLTFGTATRSMKGRAAHELYATLIENGVASDGAAGSIFEAVTHLSCTIKPAEVKQRGGGGADCTIDAAPGS